MPITNIRTFEWIKTKLSGSEERNERAAQALLDVYDASEDGQLVVETFLSRSEDGVQISSQPILDVYEAVKHNPEDLKRFLAKRDFAVYQRCLDG